MSSRVISAHGRTTEDPVAGTQSLDRALNILFEIAGSAQGGMTLAQCSSILGYSKPTTQRMLLTLAKREFLNYDEQAGLYTLGVANARLGTQYLARLDYRRAALPAMRELVAETDETAHLGTLSGTNVVYVEMVESSLPVRIFSRVGETAPVYAAAIGKAILAWSAPDAVDAHLPAVLEPRTPNTLTTRDALEADLAATRVRGYAVDDVENREGVRGFAAPIFDQSGTVVAGVSIGGPVDRVGADSEARLGPRVAAVAAEISRVLGAPEHFPSPAA